MKDSIQFLLKYKCYVAKISRVKFSIMFYTKVENASHIDLRWNNGATSETEGTSNASITTAKWCPLENCTVLVLGKLRALINDVTLE